MADGYRSDTLQEKLSELEVRKAGLEAELAAPPPSPVRFHPKLAEVYRQKVEDLTEALADPTIRDEAFAIIRRLIQEVIINPREDHSFEVELVVEITKMLALPDGKTSFDKCSVKVVAGGRYQRCLHLNEVWLKSPTTLA